jgi:hypothetical protein
VSGTSIGVVEIKSFKFPNRNRVELNIRSVAGCGSGRIRPPRTGIVAKQFDAPAKLLINGKDIAAAVRLEPREDQVEL